MMKILLIKITTIMPLLCLLAGCGFKPLYQQSLPLQNTLPFVLEVTGDQEEAYGTYLFKQELKTLLGQMPPSPIKKVKIKLTEIFGDIGFREDASVIRVQGKVIADFKIYTASLTPIYEDRAEAVSAYTPNNAEEFASLSARKATRERVIISLARDIAMEIQIISKAYPTSKINLTTKPPQT